MQKYQDWRDTATSEKNNINSIMRSFLNKEIDILVGTQMIAKGLDFPMSH